MKAEIGIYIIINKINKKIYIGSSVNLERRLREHKYKLASNKHENSYLQASYNKYTIEAFTYDILEECTIEELSNREEYWIKHFSSHKRDFGYNLESILNGRKQLSEETKELIRQANIGKKKNLPIEVELERRKKISRFHKGRKRALEHGKKISITKLSKSKVYTSQERLNIAEGHTKYLDVYDLKGKLHHKKISSKDLAKQLNISDSTILYSAKNKGVLLKKYIIIYTGEIPIIKDYVTNKVKNPVAAYDYLNKKILFNSVKECASHFSTTPYHVKIAIERKTLLNDYYILYEN